MYETMNTRFDELSRRLNQLPSAHWMAFALDCAENVLSFIEKWSAAENTDLAHVAGEAVAFLKTNLRTLDVVQPQIQGYLEAVGEAIPHTEESDTISPSGALDAGLTVLKALRCAVNLTFENTLQTAKNAITAYDITSFSKNEDLLTPQEWMMRDLEPSAIVEWERQLAVIAKFQSQCADLE